MSTDTTGGSCNLPTDNGELSAPADGEEKPEDSNVPLSQTEQTTLKHRSKSIHVPLARKRFYYYCQWADCPWFISSNDWYIAIEAANQHAHRMRFQ